MFRRVSLFFKWGDESRSDLENDPQVLVAVREGFSSYEWFRDKDFLTREYIRKQKSIAQIARDVGCSRSSVSKYLVELGIEPRKDGLPHHRKSQLAYGERIQNGRVVPHLGEQRMIEELRQLRLGGLSFAALAKWLDSRNVPTKNRVGKWDRRTVWEILQRGEGSGS